MTLNSQKKKKNLHRFNFSFIWFRWEGNAQSFWFHFLFWNQN